MNAIAEPPNVNVTPPTPALGDLVRAPRLELGLTQVELADRVGMSQRWISNIERNETDLPRREHLLRLAEALTLDVADLYDAGSIARSRRTVRAIDDATADDPVIASLIDELRDLDMHDLSAIRQMVRSLKRRPGA